MPSTPCLSASPLPPQVADIVRDSVVNTLGSILGAAPALRETEPSASPSVIGIIGFVGDLNLTVALGLPEATAPALVEKFAGFAIPFDSPDMGDVVGELANVLAGEVRARLENKKIKAQMSLPTVARGSDLELLAVEGAASMRFTFDSPAGPFWCGVTSGPAGGPARMPGQ